jgi:glycosyltransferase involved in cell wall biosynthesis
MRYRYCNGNIFGRNATPVKLRYIRLWCVDVLFWQHQFDLANNHELKIGFQNVGNLTTRRPYVMKILHNYLITECAHGATAEYTPTMTKIECNCYILNDYLCQINQTVLDHLQHISDDYVLLQLTCIEWWAILLK